MKTSWHPQVSLIGTGWTFGFERLTISVSPFPQLTKPQVKASRAFSLDWIDDCHTGLESGSRVSRR